jgi:plastocyanin
MTELLSLRARRIGGALLGAFVALGPFATQADPTPAATTVVHISTFLKFGPKAVTIPVGGTVEWLNSSIETHTVTDDPAEAKDPAHAELPAGAQAFDSGPLKPANPTATPSASQAATAISAGRTRCMGCSAPSS